MNERKGTLIRKKYNEYLVSTLAMSASLYLAAIVDNIMVGNILGAGAMSAVNLTTPVVYIKNIVFCIFIYGGNTLAATYSGKRERQNADKAFTFSVVFGIIASALTVLAGILLAAPTAALLSQNGALYRETYEYLIPCWASGPFIVLNSGLAAYVRTDGMKKLASALPIVSNVINLTLDYVFMKIFGWGVSGAGWATVAGYAAGSLLLIPYFMSKRRTAHFTRVRFSDMKILAEVLKTGLPTALIHVCNFFRTMFINAIILSAEGELGIQIVTICLSALNFALIFIHGTSTTFMPICGALYGERDTKGVKYVLKTALMVSGTMCFIMLALFELFPLSIGGLFGKLTPETAAALETAIRLFAVSVPFYGIAYLLRVFYQCTKQRLVASVFTVVEGAAVIVPMIWVSSMIDSRLIWLSFGMSEFLSVALTVIVMQIIAKRRNYTGFLMLDNSEEKNTLDMTISNSVQSAVDISKGIYEFCTGNGVDKKAATALSVTAEELAANAAKYAYKHTGEIDICMRINDDSLVLRFRDNGVPFDPLGYTDDSGREITGLSVARKLTPDITYNRVLGFNVTVVTVLSAKPSVSE